MRETWLWIVRSWRDHRPLLVPLTLLTLTSASLAVCLPMMIRRIFHELEGTFSPRIFAAAIGALTLVGIMRFTVYAALQSTRSLVNHRMERDIRFRLFERLLTLGPSFHSSHSTGDMLTRLTDDLQDMKLSWFLCSGLFRLLEALSIIFIGLAVCIGLQPILTMVTTVLLVVVVLAIYKVAAMLEDRYRRHQTAISQVNSELETSLGAIRLVKAFAVEDQRSESVRAAFEERREAQWSVICGEMSLDAFHEYSWQVVSALNLLIGGWLVIHHRMNIPDLVAFSAFSLTLTAPLFDIGRFFIHARQARVIIDRLRRIEEHAPDVADPAVPLAAIAPEAPLGARDLGYTHPGARQPVLSDIELQLAPGQFVALTGRVGAGKSTLLGLLMRLIDPTTGGVCRGSVPLTDLSLPAARAGVGYVPQDPHILSGTLADNVRFGRTGLDDATVRRALEAAHLARDFPPAELLGIDVGPRGTRLSGGQRQRLALARALAGRPAILLVDDGSASLDAETEASIVADLRSALEGTSVLWVTQRRRVLEAADRILVLEAGRLVQSGRHGELVAAPGEYRDLHG